MRRICILIALAIPVAGCGSSVVRARPITTRLSSKAPRRLAWSVSGPPIGTTQTVDARGARLAVTVRAVVDPLRGAGVRLALGARAVGVMVQIRSSGPALYDSSATGDFHLVPARGMATPVLATRGVCRTPLEDFDRYITAGEDRVGCVVFSVRAGVPLAGVRFDPHGRARGRLTWRIRS